MQGLVICWIIIWGLIGLGDLGDVGGGVGVLISCMGDFGPSIVWPVEGNLVSN